ncbi:hypothetical protein SAMN05444369_102128 [Capnocytophaga haemolytica]|uniref:Uncharacterized protein n=1 Tax=Capnocytophaga haemolytica TaxID=45243 RepID=A0AAX2GWL6_9FLAO|nr:hypothetical protein [Capnocytophaga haemolytica]AMD84823.1 hypothetical protein AXF12_04415 [Capnocytophaga haemolytica]SFN75478.1 hypothetical protein SAMN05444369_102128 [Capnocytophaga haemolytica]SNV07069.1 Uncharacterised protein [Capnocytophaga haemolytica]
MRTLTVKVSDTEAARLKALLNAYGGLHVYEDDYVSIPEDHWEAIQIGAREIAEGKVFDSDEVYREALLICKR